MVDWVGLWVFFFFFFSCELGWVQVIRFTNLPSLTQLAYFKFKIYLKIYYTILLFTFLPLFLNKTQTLSSSHIVCVGLVLYSGLFGYEFAIICGEVILMLNLIIIVVIKKNCPTWSTWIGLEFFFLTHHGELGWKIPLTRPMHTSTEIY